MSLTLACGDSTTTPDAITFARIAVAVEPDPVSAQASTDPEFDFVASFTVTLTETAGIGTTFNATTVNVTETSDGNEVGGDEDEIYKTEVGTEPDRIEANERVQIPFDIFYRLPEGGSEARIDVTTSIIDDNGYQVGGILQVRVQ
jgi:hypothetical protein